MAQAPGRLITLHNRTSLARVEPRYLPIVEATTTLCRRVLGDELLEIRILGSVARGDAVAGLSDIDFAAITGRPVTAVPRAEIERWAAQASTRYSQVFAVDIDLYDLPGIDANRALRLILETDSASVWGAPQLAAGDRTLTTAELAGVWDIQVAGMARNYEDAVRRAPGDRLAGLSRVVGKDLLKCWRMRLVTMHGVFDQAMPELYDHLKAQWPEYKDLFKELWSLYGNPVDNRECILRVLQRALEIERGLEGEG